MIDKKAKEFDILFDDLSKILDGKDLDAVIPALILHLAASAICTNMSPDAVLQFVSNTFKRTYETAGKNLPTQGGMQ